MAIVRKPFTITLPDHSQRSFVPGDAVEGDLADHWYVAAHCQEEAGAEAPVESETSEETSESGDEADASETKPKKM